MTRRRRAAPWKNSPRFKGAAQRRQRTNLHFILARIRVGLFHAINANDHERMLTRRRAPSILLASAERTDASLLSSNCNTKADEECAGNSIPPREWLHR